MKKKCKNCGKALNLAMFHKNKHSKDGLQSWCKHCKSDYSKKRSNSLKEIKKEIKIPEKNILIFCFKKYL